MIGFIKKIFSGILSFLVGLVGGKKSQALQAGTEAATKKRKRNGYFMELDEDEDIKPATAIKSAKETAVKTLETAKDTAAKSLETAAQAVKIPAKTSEPVAKAAKAEPATASATKVAANKTSESSNNGQAAQVELVQTAEGLKAEIAKPTSSASTNGQAKTETTFAPKYLNPSASSNSRRRPGPSMSPFLDMARQVKPSN